MSDKKDNVMIDDLIVDDFGASVAREINEAKKKDTEISEES